MTSGDQCLAPASAGGGEAHLSRVYYAHSPVSASLDPSGRPWSGEMGLTAGRLSLRCQGTASILGCSTGPCHAEDEH